MAKDKSKCATRYCRNSARPAAKTCYKCNMRKFKETHPLEYCFNILRTNAKRRGKSFELTKEQFKIFCEETQYLTKKGVTKRKLHIDRIDSSKGYSIDNIQILTCSENSRKGAYEKHPF